MTTPAGTQTTSAEPRDIRREFGLRPIINVSGTMTALGASIMVPEAIAAMAAIAPEFVEIDQLQRAASRVIARLTGGEAGFVTASCASGIAVAVAGAMTRDNLLAVERLPDTRGLRNEVLIQVGHMVSYGAPVDQSIRLAGGTVVTVGTVSSAYEYQLEHAISERTAMALYSGHKFLGGPTSGIVAGRKDLVRAAYLQNRGIGRGMKVGKESIAGVMAALEAWDRRNHAGIRAREREALELWRDALAPLRGVLASIEPDPTANPLDRLKVTVLPESAFTAAGLAGALAAGDPPVIVRDHEAELGYFFLDPCNLHAGEAEAVASRLVATLKTSNRARFEEANLRRNVERLLQWPD